MADDQLRIRLLAYRIWEAEECPEGQAERHWHMACRMVAAERITDVPQDAQPKPATRGKTAAPSASVAAQADADTAAEPAAKKSPAKRSTTTKRRSAADSAEGKTTTAKTAATKSSAARKTAAAKKKSADETATTKRKRSTSSNDDKPSQ